MRSGSDANPLDKPGLASFTAAVLDQGTADARRVAARRRSGADWRHRSAPAHRAMRRRCRPAASAGIFPRRWRLAGGRRAAIRAFPPKKSSAFARRGWPISSSSAGIPFRSRPTSPARRCTARIQYGFSEIGTAESNKQLTRDDLQAFWRQHFVPGQRRARRHRRDYGSRAAQAGARPHSAAGRRAPPRPRSSARPRPRRRVWSSSIVPGSPQTQLRVATFGVPRNSPDYMPVRVMNTILGGMFSSRINMNLREEHGYTYGANSQFSFWRSGGPFSVATGVRTDVTAPAVHEVMLELRKMSETRVTPQELTLAKDAITLQLPALFETNDRVVGKPVDAVHPRPAAELLLEPGRADFGRRRAGGAGGREEVPGAGQVRCRRGRRPFEDRRVARERARDDRGNPGRRRSARRNSGRSLIRYNSGPITVLFQMGVQTTDTAGRGGPTRCST